MQIKVMYLIDYLYGSEGGTEGQLLELIRNLDTERFLPNLVLLRETETEYVNRNSLPCSHRILNIRKIFSIQTLVKMFKLSYLIKREKVQLVHVFFNDSSMLAPFFCRLGGAKVIVSRRDMGFWYTYSKVLALRFANLFVNKVVANSVAVKKNVILKEHCPETKIEVIFNGHDCEKFNQIAEPNFRQGLGIGDDDPIIGMVCNLYKIKRPKDMINAFRLIIHNYPEAHLILVGGGPLEINPLKAYCVLLGVRNVHFLGRIQNVVPIVKHFDVAVLCSESEGLSNALIEYLANGRPTVCTNVGGNPEIIKDGHNGFLVDVGNIQQLADRIMQILSNAQLKSLLSKNALNEFRQKFVMERMVNSYMRLYENLINGDANNA